MYNADLNELLVNPLKFLTVLQESIVGLQID